MKEWVENEWEIYFQELRNYESKEPRKARRAEERSHGVTELRI